MAAQNTLQNVSGQVEGVPAQSVQFQPHPVAPPPYYAIHPAPAENVQNGNLGDCCYQPPSWNIPSQNCTYGGEVTFNGNGPIAQGHSAYAEYCPAPHQPQPMEPCAGQYAPSNGCNHCNNLRASAKPVAPVRQKRFRRIFTENQIKRLKQEYMKNRYIDKRGRMALAAELNLAEENVRFWFQNRRMDEKKNQFAHPCIIANAVDPSAHHQQHYAGPGDIAFPYPPDPRLDQQDVDNNMPII